MTWSFNQRYWKTWGGLVL